MSYLVLIIVLSAVVYRVSRFIALDTLIDGTRDKAIDFFERHPSFFWGKIRELLGCPWCITIWIGAFTVIAQYIFVGDVPMPVWTWLAISSGALVFWAIIDDDADDDE